MHSRPEVRERKRKRKVVIKEAHNEKNQFVYNERGVIINGIHGM